MTIIIIYKRIKINKCIICNIKVHQFGNTVMVAFIEIRYIIVIITTYHKDSTGESVW